jgi:hypothetical protein
MHLVTDGCASFSAAGREVAADGAIMVGHRKSSELEPVKLARRGRTQLRYARTGRPAVPPGLTVTALHRLRFLVGL